MNSLGRLIKATRVFQDLTQEDLGVRANINRFYMVAIERDQRIPTSEELQAIERVLGVDLSTPRANEVFSYLAPADLPAAA